MLVELVTPTRPDEDPAHVSVRNPDEVQNSPYTDEVVRVGVVLNVADGLAVRVRCSAGGFGVPKPLDIPVRVVEVIGGVAKGVDLEFLQEVLRDLGQEPVDHQTTLDTALAVQDQDDFLVLRVRQGSLDELICIPHVVRRVAEIALYQALDRVKDDSGAGRCIVQSVKATAKQKTRGTRLTHVGLCTPVILRPNVYESRSMLL